MQVEPRPGDIVGSVNLPLITWKCKPAKPPVNTRPSRRGDREALISVEVAGLWSSAVPMSSIKNPAPVARAGLLFSFR